MHLDSSDEEAAALTRADITGNDRYPFSERIGTLTAILAKLRVETSPKVQGASAPPGFRSIRRV